MKMTGLESLQNKMDEINKKIRIIEHQDKIQKLDRYLDVIVEKWLYKDERQELIQTINLKDSRGRPQKSGAQFNKYFDENKIPFTIRTYTDWNRSLNGKAFIFLRKKNPNYGKVYWVIFKTSKTAIHDLFHDSLAKTIII